MFAQYFTLIPNINFGNKGIMTIYKINLLIARSCCETNTDMIILIGANNSNIEVYLEKGFIINHSFN